MTAPLRSRPRPRPERRHDGTELRKRRPYRSDEVVGAALLAMIVAALLGSQSLVELASRRPYGPSRTVLVTVAEVVDRIAAAASLDRPARAIDSWTGKEHNEMVDIDTLLQQQQMTAPANATTPLDIDPATGLRWIDAAHPLRLLLVGDSVMADLGPSVDALAPVELTRVTLDTRVSTGLSRPDYFDWPSRLATLTAGADAPDAVVVAFGPNDFQDLQSDGAVLPAGSAEWDALYRRRVGAVMDLLGRPGTTLTWLTMPAMRDPAFSASMQHLAAIAAEEASLRPWVGLVDLGDRLDQADGSYSATVTDGDGVPRTLRQEDGVHLTREGADRAALDVWSAISRRWGITTD